MTNIGLRFILEGNNFIQTVLPVDDAKKIIDAWYNGTLTQKLRGPTWGVEVRYIRGIHTFELEPPPQPGLGRGFLGASGVN